MCCPRQEICQGTKWIALRYAKVQNGLPRGTPSYKLDSFELRQGTKRAALRYDKIRNRLPRGSQGTKWAALRYAKVRNGMPSDTLKSKMQCQEIRLDTKWVTKIPKWAAKRYVVGWLEVR